jgi:hypothetical protein
MDPTVVRALLDILIENAVRILHAGFGVDRAESTFFDIVRLLREESTLKTFFLKRVRATLLVAEPGGVDPGLIPIELIELVAHELRWKELKELAAERIDNRFGGNATSAIGDVAHHISEAFADDWPDREFYEHYRR